jgi:RimJ/RimL family protein N-acetyltransferase
MVGSQWATLNNTDAPIVARGYVPLQPGQALLHDGVTGEKYRGKGVGPFMVAGVLAALVQEFGASRVVIDVKVTNRPALRMMEKVGLTAREATFAVSAFGSLLWRLRMPAHR